jgi:predicted dehydrogenase
MGLTPEARRIGRRNFLKAVGGTSALAALGTAAVVRGPIRGGPVRAALIGYGKQGKLLHACADPEVMSIVAVCDIRPLTNADRELTAGLAYYQDWRRMLQQDQIEAVLVATPLWTHAEIAIGCLEARKHVFCETAMAMDASGCQQMIEAAKRNKRVLAVGYQDFYQPLYWAAYHNIMKQGLLGDVYSMEAAWHSYSSGRLENAPDTVTFDPRPWGYPTLDQLVNWRLYRRYSDGLMAEWGGALVSLTNWYFDVAPTAVHATGGIYSYKDGRDVNDHVYATLEYPNGRTATLSLIQSNGLEGSYTQFMGTKGTLIIGNGEALLFAEEGSSPTKIGAANVKGPHPILDSSASRSEEASNHSVLTGGGNGVQNSGMDAFRQEIAGFCGSIRTGAPMRSSAAHALDVTRVCLAVEDAVERGSRVDLQGTTTLSNRFVMRVDAPLRAQYA